MQLLLLVRQPKHPQSWAHWQQGRGDCLAVCKSLQLALGLLQRPAGAADGREGGVGGGDSGVAGGAAGACWVRC
jgi:hypothetical protein